MRLGWFEIDPKVQPYLKGRKSEINYSIFGEVSPIKEKKKRALKCERNTFERPTSGVVWNEFIFFAKEKVHKSDFYKGRFLLLLLIIIILRSRRNNPS